MQDQTQPIALSVLKANIREDLRRCDSRYRDNPSDDPYSSHARDQVRQVVEMADDWNRLIAKMITDFRDWYPLEVLLAWSSRVVVEVQYFKSHRDWRTGEIIPERFAAVALNGSSEQINMIRGCGLTESAAISDFLNQSGLSRIGVVLVNTNYQ